MVLIDDGQLQVLDVAAERVAQDDQLHSGKIIDMTIIIGLLRKRRISRSTMAQVRCYPQSRDGHLRLNMNGLSAADGSCSASRSARPV